MTNLHYLFHGPYSSLAAIFATNAPTTPASASFLVQVPALQRQSGAASGRGLPTAIDQFGMIVLFFL